MTTVLEARAQSVTQHAESAIRSVIVHVAAEPEAAPRLESAAALARKFDATLIGVGAEMIQSLGIGDPFGMLETQWAVEMRALVQDDLKAAADAFKARTAGLKAEWIALEEIPAQAVARLSRGADLIVAGGEPIRSLDVYKAADTAELVLTSGRPVLVAPPSGGALNGEAVVVAWKDSRESRRALADSLPFLKAAREVVVLEVCDKDSLADAQSHTFSVVEHLRRHGVEARAKAIVAAPDEVTDELNLTAAQIGADLIVAGGYGHSRLGEWVFGGVTRGLLYETGRFVLFSH